MLDYTMPSCSDTVTDPNACKNSEASLWLLLELLAELLMRPNWTKAGVYVCTLAGIHHFIKLHQSNLND